MFQSMHADEDLIEGSQHPIEVKGQVGRTKLAISWLVPAHFTTSSTE